MKRLVFPILVAFVATAAAAFSALRSQPNSDEEDLKLRVEQLHQVIRTGDLEALWASMAHATHAEFEFAHGNLMKWVARYQTARLNSDSPKVELMSAQRVERDHGMCLEELAATTAKELWMKHARDDIDNPAARRSYGGFSVKKIRVHADRASVDTVLADGTPQGYHFVRSDSGWKLVDFQAFWPCARWEIPRQRIAPPGTPTGVGSASASTHR